jgi:hypothetical protein
MPDFVLFPARLQLRVNSRMTDFEVKLGYKIRPRNDPVSEKGLPLALFAWAHVLQRLRYQPVYQGVNLHTWIVVLLRRNKCVSVKVACFFQPRCSRAALVHVPVFWLAGRASPPRFQGTH